MSGNANKKVSKAEVGRVLKEGQQYNDEVRVNGLGGLSRFRNSKAKMHSRESNRLNRKYGEQHPRTVSATAKLNANAEYISGLKMEAARATNQREVCDDKTWVVKGKVYDRGGCPIKQAKVAVYFSDGRRVEQLEPTRTDNKGNYKITYSVDANRDDYVRAAKEEAKLSSANESDSKQSSDPATGRLSSGIRVNADQQDQAVFVRAVDANDDSLCADSTLMVPNLGTCNYRDLIFDTNLADQLVSDVDKDRRSSRYLGNSATRELHDLKNEKANCQIDEIRIDRCVRFKSIEEAQELGYDFCAYCFGRSRSKR